MGCGASTFEGKSAQHGIFESPQIIVEKIEANPPAGPRPPSKAKREPKDQSATQAGITALDFTGDSATGRPQIFSKRQLDPTNTDRGRKSTSRVTTSSTGPYMNTLEEKFPGAIPEDFFIQQATEILERHGFTPSNAINLVSTCRDEICRSFTLELDRLWGPSFSISSLAGMVFCGRTGFKAAMAHSPVIGGKERYVFWVMPHIGLSNEGLFGRSRPPLHFSFCSLASLQSTILLTCPSPCPPLPSMPPPHRAQGLPPRPRASVQCLRRPPLHPQRARGA
jgi:hypothetical protein